MAVPKLRFKEFNDSWDLKKLDHIAEVNPKTKELPASFFYIDLESVSEGLLIQRKKIDINEAPSRAQRLLEKSDVLFQMVRPYQQNNFYFDLDGDYVASTGYAQIRTKLNSKYIYYVLHSKKFLDEVINRCTGTSYPAINSSELSSIEVAFPSIREQTKIASFLSAVDEKISQLTQKHQLLSQYKQGMMQKLFSQQIRFKADDGREFGEWVFSEIGGVFKFKQGKQVPIEDQNLNMTDTSARFIRIVDLTSRNEPPRYIVDYSKNDLIKKDDLFMVRYGSPGLLGFGYEGVIANNLFRIIPIHPKQVYSKFSYHLFDSLYQQVCQLSSSTTMPAISFASLNTLKVCLPSLEEQTKIANFLSTIDQKIEVVAQQIEQAKEWKKGLLQQMFI